MNCKTKLASLTMQNNFDDENLEYISKPFENDVEHYNQSYTMVQKNSSCEVTPSVSSMSKSAKILMD